MGEYSFLNPTSPPNCLNSFYRIVNVDWDSTLVGKDDSHGFTFQLIFNILLRIDANFSGTFCIS